MVRFLFLQAVFIKWGQNHREPYLVRYTNVIKSMKMELISEQRAGQKGEKTKKDEKLVYNLE